MRLYCILYIRGSAVPFSRPTVSKHGRQGGVPLSKLLGHSVWGCLALWRVTSSVGTAAFHPPHRGRDLSLRGWIPGVRGGVDGGRQLGSARAIRSGKAGKAPWWVSLGCRRRRPSNPNPKRGWGWRRRRLEIPSLDAGFGTIPIPSLGHISPRLLPPPPF